jgi:hypothetical protein
MARALLQMRDAALNGTQAMETLSSITGITREELTKMIDTHPEQALLLFSDVLDDMNKKGISTTAFLQQLNLNTEETKRVFGTLAGSGDLVRQSLARAFKQAEGPEATGALAQEAAQRMKSFDAAVTQTGEAWVRLKRDIGAALAPGFTALLKGITAVLNGMTSALNSLSPAMKTFVSYLVTVGPAAILAVVGLKSLFGIVTSLFGLFGGASGSVGVLAMAFAGLKAAAVGLGAIFAGIATAIGVSVAVLAGIVVAIVAAAAAIWYFWDEIRDVLAMSPKEIWQAVSTAVVNAVTGGIKWAAEKLSNVGAILGGWWESISQTFEGLADAMKKWWNSTVESVWDTMKSIWDNLWNFLRTLPDIDWGALAAVIANGIITALDQAWERVKARAKQFGQDIINSITEWWEKPVWELDPQVKIDREKAKAEALKAKEEATRAATAGGTNKIEVPVELQPKGERNVFKELTEQQLKIVESLGKEAEETQKLINQQRTLNELAKLDPRSQSRQRLGATDEALKRWQDLIEIRKRYMNPVTKKSDELDIERSQAAAVTQAQKDRLEVETAIRDLIIERGKLSDEELQNITKRIQAVQQEKAARAVEENVRGSARRIEDAKAVTQAAKDQLEIERAIADMKRTQANVTDAQVKQMTEVLRLAQLTANLMNTISQLDPVGTAQRGIAEQAKNLEYMKQNADKLGISLQQINRMQTQLNENAIQANPWAAQVRSMDDALQKLKIMGDYEDADRKTLETILQLRRQGMEVSQQQVEMLKEFNRLTQEIQKAQSSGFVGWAKSVGTLKDNLLDLQKDFASGLSSAISGALKGEQDTFRKFLLNISSKMIDLGVNQIMKEMMGGMGLLKGPTAEIAKAQSLADQLKSLSTASMSVQAAVVNINGPSGTAIPKTDISGAGTGPGQTPAPGTLGAASGAIAAATSAGGVATGSIFKQSVAAQTEMANAIQKSAKDLGVSAKDMATIISFETGGTFDPWKKGPTTKWGEHRGLIQWGEPQREKYGVTQDSSVSEQMDAVTKYMKDRGVKPGMGLMDLYSTVNAGAPGLQNRSDAKAGGTWGTVADKVNFQMEGHKANADKLLQQQTSAAEQQKIAAEQQQVTANALPQSVKDIKLPELKAPEVKLPEKVEIKDAVIAKDEGVKAVQQVQPLQPQPPFNAYAQVVPPDPRAQGFNDRFNASFPAIKPEVAPQARIDQGFAGLQGGEGAMQAQVDAAKRAQEQLALVQQQAGQQQVVQAQQTAAQVQTATTQGSQAIKSVGTASQQAGTDAQAAASQVQASGTGFQQGGQQAVAGGQLASQGGDGFIQGGQKAQQGGAMAAQGGGGGGLGGLFGGMGSIGSSLATGAIGLGFGLLLNVLTRKKKKKFTPDPIRRWHTGGPVEDPDATPWSGTSSKVQDANEALKPDEYRAILKRGERVLTSNDAKETVAQLKGLQDEVSTMRSMQGADAQRFGQQGGNVYQQVNNIVTKDPDSFRKSEGQLWAESSVKMRRFGARNT